MSRRPIKRKQPRVTLESLPVEDREFIGRLMTLPQEMKEQWIRLLELLAQASRCGDEFTWKRFDRLAKPGWEMSKVLPELERRPPTR